MSEKHFFVNAESKSVSDILDKKKYGLDFYQREYLWQKKHIQYLIEDLTTKFLMDFNEKHERIRVKDYSKYFMGSIILNLDGNSVLIIDGQQRLTSLTLLLIYLNNSQKNYVDGNKVHIDNLIFSESFGKKSFNLQIDDRTDCIKSLYDKQYFDTSEKNESVINLKDRYEDIEKFFPTELTEEYLPYFIDWLLNNVMFVVIETYSDKDAYKIFETMNDRGLSLTPTDMLKGYLLSKITTNNKTELNSFWKQRITEIRDTDKNADIEFFQAWLRGKYADTIRKSEAGATDEDFEIIGSKFHSWVKDNEKKIGLEKESSYFEFIKINFDFYSKQYLKILEATSNLNEKFKHVFFIEFLGLAPSLYYPLFLAPLNLDDDDKTIDKKIQLVSKYLETYSVYRKINRHNISHSTIRNYVYHLIKEIRNKSIIELVEIFTKLLAKQRIEEPDQFLEYTLEKQNKNFVKFLLARITSHIEEKSNIQSSFEKYVKRGRNKRFEIEHIWADKFEEHKGEFSLKTEFEEYRNRLGGLILIPEGFNQSYGALPYVEKLEHYFKQNLLSQSLYSKCYDKDPSFLRYIKESNLPFQSYTEFTRNSISERQELYKKICEEIWNVEKFDEF